jgi:hypothetical protein
MSDNRRGTGRIAGLAVLVAAGVLLSGCGGGEGDESGTAAKAGREMSGASRADGTSGDSNAPSGGSPGSGGGQAAAATSTNVRALVTTRDIIYRGSVTVRVKRIEAALVRAEQIVHDAGGVVYAEETSTDGPGGTSRAHLTLRVPPSEFRSVMAKMSAELGKGLRKSQTAEDVTTQIVDTASRIETQRTSVARVRALLEKATDLDDIVRLEPEVARREGDLESLEAQLARLKDVTAEATIEVELVEARAGAVTEDDSDAGFMVGLRGGWRAFVEIVQVGLTVAGALLPFVLTASLIGLPVWLVLRSRVRRRVVTAPQTPAV